MNISNTHSPLIVNSHSISESDPTYFIADIAANHDGDLEKAKELIWLSAEAGADAAKFQHFKADTIVSDFGFKSLGGQQSHQSTWEKSVYEVYADAEVDLNWTEELVNTCKQAEIDFFTSPYDFDLADYIDQFVPAHKIGSGDITWHAMLEHIAKKNKPYFLATGASELADVVAAVEACLKINPKLVLMQCNTNYTASLENFAYINLNVLKTYRTLFPELVLGLSDHTPGHSTVLGAVALGARVIEKHFTDDNQRNGPDHKFSMNPVTWKEMVDRTRELEAALGSPIKKVEANEAETVVLQRRSVRLTRDMKAGEVLVEADLECLRPAPVDAFLPYQLQDVIGLSLKQDMVKGEHLRPDLVGKL
ncbi:N-acetylneuraminate synthase family protein [Neptuniibacter caesariensis]|uniref:N-acetylneuraminate synthase n=1 Tax=Neptuniibacter caesariensis TaxID=207954 RepID=A0A7U8C223_NEPCE|nr:N-acetylneuraminate synthase family protein [Neptuniibacter caesariensis]EAR60077.1 N-acetylneuraminate synthase [Oceanospirillum sp. MED92] [Neptuniibacter caesariensis]